jgi:hypothetical protein
MKYRMKKMMIDNLLTKPAECHRTLLKVDTFSVQDLINYYALSFARENFYGNSITSEQLEQYKERAIRAAPKWDEEDLQKLLDLVDQVGIEIVLYAIDLVDSDGYPTVKEIRTCIPDAEAALASMIRTRDFGVM